jgi:DNA (cytosine-5)-methyltransferase 1
MFKVVDMFCGAGGESVGIENAAKEAGEHLRLSAINHWERAIETHKLNFPDAVHYCENVETLNPHDVCGVREKIGLLWASPECTHHSNARGGRPCSDQSRATAWHILKWASELYIRRIIIENVPEFVNWGPLGSDGRPLKQQKGKTFEIFIKALQVLGYKVEWQFLCAANYGDPTTRRRFFLQAVRGNGRIVWPQQTHSETPGPFKTKPWVAAREIIDWKLAGESIIHRKKPLAAATMRRIEAGIKRYWGQWAEPFLVVLRGTGNVRDLGQPAPAITAGGTHLGLVESFLVRYNGDRKGKGDSSKRNYPISSPIGTLDCSNRYGVVEPFILHQMTPGRPRSINEPLPTITSQSGHGIVEPFLINYYGNGRHRSIKNPLDTVTTKDRFGVIEPFLVQFNKNCETRSLKTPMNTLTTKEKFGLVEGKPVGLDITFRMLQPHELAAAQGFPKGYSFTGNKSEQVKQIGNAVPANTAKALALCAMGAA